MRAVLYDASCSPVMRAVLCDASFSLCHASFSLSSRACRGINAERFAGTLGHRGKETRLLANLRLLRIFGLSFRATWSVLSARWCEEVLGYAVVLINSFLGAK